MHNWDRDPNQKPPVEESTWGNTMFWVFTGIAIGLFLFVTFVLMFDAESADLW